MDAVPYTARDLTRFLWVFATVFVLGLAVPYGLIFVVDPWERFMVDPNNISINREREAKPRFIKTYPHNAVLIGSSKLAHVDPADIDTPDLRFFNASFAGALPEEMYSFLDIFVPDAKVVVISLDIIPMNENTWGIRPTEWGAPSFKDAAIAYWKYLKDPDVLSLSLKYVWNGRPERTILKPNGARIASSEMARSEAMPAPDFAQALARLKGAAFGEFKYSEERIRYLEKIRDLLKKRGIPFVVLISPENRQMLQMIKTSPAAWALDRFRADIRRIFPDAIDYSDSWVSADDNFYRFDPLHYMPKPGAKMVREALAQAQ